MKIFKKWWFWVLIVLVVIIGASAGDNNVEQTGQEADITPPAEQQPVEPEPEPEPVIDPITFNNFIVYSNFGVTTAHGEAVNNSDKMHSFTLTVSFYDAVGKLLGVAYGAVNELAPGDTKIFTAMATDDFTDADQIKIDVDTMIESRSNYTKPAIEFTNFVSKVEFGITQLNGEVTNNTDGERSFTIVAGFYDDANKLLGVASGAINDIPAGNTKTFTLMGTQDLSAATTIRAQVDTMVE